MITEEFLARLRKDFPKPYFEISAQHIHFTSGYYSPRHVEHLKEILREYGVKIAYHKEYRRLSDLPPSLCFWFDLN